MHSIGEHFPLSVRDGFELTVHLEPDTECNAHDYGQKYSDADLAAWQLDWRFVGIVVEAARGRVLGHAGLWAVEHGTMGNGQQTDALSRGGLFSGDTKETVVTEAIMDAVDTLRQEGNRQFSESEYDRVEDLSTPTITRSAEPDRPAFPWSVAWPDGQVTTYRTRSAACDAALRTVRYLWPH